MKNWKFKIIIILLTFFIVIDVNALCSPKEKRELKQEAYKVEITHSFDFDFESNPQADFFLEGVNLTENVWIRDGAGKRFEKDLSLGDDQVYGFGYYPNASKVVFNFLASKKTNCPGEVLHTKTYQIPKFNTYSWREECAKNKKFNMCDPWYKGNISDEKTFLAALKKYQADLKEQEKIEAAKPFYVKAFEAIKKNPKIALAILGGLILVVAIAVIVSTQLKKKKVKLDLEG